MLDSLKNYVRTIEARITPRTTEVQFRGHALRFYRSAWWVCENQSIFEQEIVPYFACIERPVSELKCIVDAGAATGVFSIAASRIFPDAHFTLFEPSVRQRVLLERNLRLNGLDTKQVNVFETALWNREETVTFRTIGAMSSIESASHLAGKLNFTERVATITLDEWCQRTDLPRVDLVKMDIEGSEIEAIAGAKRTLSRFKPELLVMAYHLREGGRTFERCANQLSDLGYEISESPHAVGLLHGVAQ